MFGVCAPFGVLRVNSVVNVQIWHQCVIVWTKYFCGKSPHAEWSDFAAVFLRRGCERWHTYNTKTGSCASAPAFKSDCGFRVTHISETMLWGGCDWNNLSNLGASPEWIVSVPMLCTPWCRTDILNDMFVQEVHWPQDKISYMYCTILNNNFSLTDRNRLRWFLCFRRSTTCWGYQKWWRPWEMVMTSRQRRVVVRTFHLLVNFFKLFPSSPCDTRSPTRNQQEFSFTFPDWSSYTGHVTYQEKEKHGLQSQSKKD